MCNPVQTPLPSGFRPEAATNEEAEAAKDLDFPQIAGSILHVSTICRPDLSYAASVSCRYLSKWNTTHYKAAKHLLRYIRGIHLGLAYGLNPYDHEVLGYADADWGGCLDTNRFTSGTSSSF